ncbi:MAG: hypothetical protein QOF02_1654 [Blastocatellia bacterium]|nr:hypothetical protein [Blastocatellia bacterium]
MIRFTVSLILAAALIVLAIVLTTNRVSADRKTSAVAQDGPTSPDGLWREISDTALARRALPRQLIPQSYRTFQLNQTALKNLLGQAPMESTGAVSDAQVTMSLPLPDGTYSRFRIVESPIMAPELAAKFPEIKTYSGQGIDDRTATARFDQTPDGFHAMVISSGGTTYVDPYAKGDTINYISYYKRDAPNDRENFHCLVTGQSPAKAADAFEPSGPSVSSGPTLRTYRLALAATAEYTNVFRLAGDTDAQAKARALAAMVVTMNRVDGVYEREVAVRMVMIAGELDLIYTDVATEPYTNDDGFAMLDENQANLDDVVGTDNYDIGHVFSTGGGGVAQIRAPCDASAKAMGVTGLPNPTGDGFAIDYVAHEMGHQFGANHTFNSTTSNCGGGNRSASSAYEPGSGSTIMPYAGICGSSDLQLHSDDYFHIRSLNEITAFISNASTGNSCAVNSATGNTQPAIEAGPNFNIPVGTPFTLTAVGSDPNGDALTYCWEEFDLGAASPPNTDATSPRPILRSYLPTTNPSRTFPSLQYILNNANVPPSTYNCGRATTCLTGEILPSITRTMTFQVTARDNRASGGGATSDSMQVIVSALSGPFVVTQPNTAISWAGNSTQTVTWNVANTTLAPVSAANVKISLSTDGGNTFPVVLLASTANDGSEPVVIPNTATATARIKVEAVGNIFFDVSNTNFTITPSGPVASAHIKVADFDGDGKSDISNWQGASTGNWLVLKSSNSNSLQVQSEWGRASLGDIAVPGDYDGDGKTDFAVWRPSEGNWYVLRSSNGTVLIKGWGQAGDVPISGDFDGDLKTDYAVFRPGEGNWYVLKNAGGVLQQGWGTSTDKAVSGDFDNDGKTDFAVFRSSEGNWYVLKSTGGATIQNWGQSGDVPVPADYDGDGKTDYAIVRGGAWYIINSGNGSVTLKSWGDASDLPVPADFDNDGKADIAVFRPSEANWYIVYSQTNAGAVLNLGQSGDTPVPNAYLPH